jgi:hypothetical protein
MSLAPGADPAYANMGFTHGKKSCILRVID